ncbi:MAG: putative peptidoglycan lipid II flippase MurJ [Parcubacteria group bacterium GW2011_GWA1_33_6]|uniref:Probable lipid II flippase MurJ n=1 Tax=Candidatus Staskawiczbacteria bacterium RIFCSPHIGHO2_02_FULL_33_16 TaxID=1802204 RepID=A0A1G2HUB5_9BACT|nr:MAG: putative peptidoglycan lipid II flippase MurJ [Parcubacteria group bacterium GW2011_GWA2_33_14]KKP54984.1 MAG: putative peptidoglycan lipid II flippase MurJ [Parcubacteria group bacterium GW2011_GWA1_33_6]OGZ65468.1 MAG: murein biosynthesis integral membrane protein MurJ [Candidatus Staskawiczbacteria bacterium RIFCSPHIGHO2_02_FULL_33_16]OGZ69985.1 MAG: murein biosynthesis integral membrane protein MurJ [Candidatus Staskawiczbacteria bacterium RIFCSPLOWO2_01_FULL_33_13]
MFTKFLNIQTKSISFASLILAASYFCSALLGLFRDRLLAGRFGLGNELDVYYAAFTIPDFIALILVFGAISSAIIPIFSSYLVTSQDDAWRYASNLLNIFLVCLIVVSLIFIIFAPFFVSLIAPGFSPEKREMTVTLMRIMFLSPIILGISNIISGILQVFKRFLVTAMAPLMYNLGIIVGIIFFVPKFGLIGLAFGVVLGGVLHLLIQIPAFLYSGFVYKPLFDFKHAGVVKTLKLMVPRSLGLGAGQLNTIATTAIASTLAVGSIGALNLANNLSAMVVNAFAVSLSTAIFPAMALAYSKENKKEFERKFSSAFLQIIFFTVPISILIFILRAQIVRVVLGTGKFGWLDTRLTAACLGVFAVGLSAQGLIFILSKTFYAAHNTKIPAWISFGTVVFNVLMSLGFVWLLNAHGLFFNLVQFVLRLDGIDNIGVLGLPIAFSITGIAEALLLLYFLYIKFKVFRLSHMALSLYKIALAGALTAATAFLARQILVSYNLVNLQTFLGVFFQLSFSSVVGIVCYIGMALILKSPELEMIKNSFLPKFFNKHESRTH